MLLDTNNLSNKLYLCGNESMQVFTKQCLSCHSFPCHYSNKIDIQYTPHNKLCKRHFRMKTIDHFQLSEFALYRVK